MCSDRKRNSPVSVYSNNQCANCTDVSWQHTHQPCVCFRYSSASDRSHNSPETPVLSTISLQSFSLFLLFLYIHKALGEVPIFAQVKPFLIRADTSWIQKMGMCFCVLQIQSVSLKKKNHDIFPNKQEWKLVLDSTRPPFSLERGFSSQDHKTTGCTVCAYFP